MILETICFSCAQAGQEYDTHMKSDNCLKSENYQNILTKRKPNELSFTERFARQLIVLGFDKFRHTFALYQL